MKPAACVLFLLLVLIVLPLLAGCIQFAHMQCGPDVLETLAQRIGTGASEVQTVTCSGSQVP
jgi:hypothetical protein